MQEVGSQPFLDNAKDLCCGCVGRAGNSGYGRVATIMEASSAEQPAVDIAASKGKGKGKTPPPPPRGYQVPTSKALPPKKKKEGDAEGYGMSQLLNKVQNRFENIDANHSVELENVDLSGINESIVRETYVCPRCEKDILVSERESHFNAHSSEILPWLYLGSKQSANNGKELTVRTGITHIVNVALECGQDHVARQEWQDYNREKGVPCEYFHFEWVDRPEQDIIAEINEPLEKIHTAREENAANKVLVHCIQGISRSASVILCYLMVYEKMSLESAYTLLKNRRPVASPRKEFLEQLGSYECKLFNIPAPSLSAEEVYKDKNVLNVD